MRHWQRMLHITMRVLPPMAIIPTIATRMDLIPMSITTLRQ
ncbi:hypothetical protein IL54_0193 [Sphingobium sp. ba1]|jgi:hypothetical protein|uniref:Uncharacterized protein n=1 Tax=Sphingomonas sanxanigenens DSM 19645 = NX02 TaxID=1123269 RepID=W0A5E6_9SPHN|nr:hypothetical protein NX02_02560 [Sphingomonas sanxanigenens DSM 19645 = NX02]KFL44827.1 hypothetical protein IL54_0193 [Sphingobium sp. ba1]